MESKDAIVNQKKSWKTTVCGALAGLLALLAVYLDAKGYHGEAKLATGLTPVVFGLGLILAKDHKKER